MTELTEKTLATERKYTGKIVSVDLLDIELPDGRKAKREVIRHGNAVAILARRPDGKPDAGKMKPICFDTCQHVYRIMGEVVAPAFSCGKELM